MEKENVKNSALAHLKGREMIYSVFENEIFSSPYIMIQFHQDIIIKHQYQNLLIRILSEDLQPRGSTEGRGIKILPPEQMLQRLLILLAQVKAGKMSKNLLKEIQQSGYSFYWAKEILKKVYNNLRKSL